MTFREGRQPLSRVVSLLFSVSYPQARRSYYLFFNYLFFTTCTCFHFARICGGTCFHFARICGLAVFPLCTWKTVPNHTSLWK